MGNGQQILQVNVPTTAAHLPAHNVGSLADQLTLKPLQEVKDKVGELVHDTFLTSKACIEDLPQGLGSEGTDTQAHC